MAFKNFAYSTVVTPPSPADSGASVTVVDADVFPAPPFNATVWPTGLQPLASNAEIVQVTAAAANTFTITREQEDSDARSIIAGDQIAATVTAKTLTDLEGWQTVTQSATLTTDADAFVGEHIFDLGAGPHIVTSTVTVVALDGDGETWSPSLSGTGIIVQQDVVITIESGGATEKFGYSFDGISYIALTPSAVHEPDLLTVGAENFALMLVPRYLRLNVAIADNATFNRYSGANHPTATIRFDIEYTV